MEPWIWKEEYKPFGACIGYSNFDPTRLFLLLHWTI